MTILERQNRFVGEFNQIKGWEDRYKKIIEIGRSLTAMADDLKIDDNKVKGCQSSVWLTAEYREGKIFFQADSDAAIVKGLVAILLEVYSNSTPAEILAASPQFLSELGLNTNLSQTRVSGLASMVKQIKFYAIAFQAKGLK